MNFAVRGNQTRPRSLPPLPRPPLDDRVPPTSFASDPVHTRESLIEDFVEVRCAKCGGWMWVDLKRANDTREKRPPCEKCSRKAWTLKWSARWPSEEIIAGHADELQDRIDTIETQKPGGSTSGHSESTAAVSTHFGSQSTSLGASSSSHFGSTGPVSWPSEPSNLLAFLAGPSFLDGPGDDQLADTETQALDDLMHPLAVPDEVTATASTSAGFPTMAVLPTIDPMDEEDLAAEAVLPTVATAHPRTDTPQFGQGPWDVLSQASSPRSSYYRASYGYNSDAGSSRDSFESAIDGSDYDSDDDHDDAAAAVPLERRQRRTTAWPSWASNLRRYVLGR